MSKRPLKGTGTRLLTESERQLWDDVTRDVRRNKKRSAKSVPGHRRLAGAAAASAAVATTQEPAGSVENMLLHRAVGLASRNPAPKAIPEGRAVKTEPKKSPLTPIDHKTRRVIRRGGMDIDARIDLHGMRQESAHRHLVQFVQDASETGARMVLVITGKGRTSPDYGPGQREDAGILRRLAPIWLGEPLLRSLVIGFGIAERHHGGDGALYVRIRQKRKLRSGNVKK